MFGSMVGEGYDFNLILAVGYFDGVAFQNSLINDLKIFKKFVQSSLEKLNQNFFEL